MPSLKFSSRKCLSFLVVIVLNAIFLSFFLNRFWCPQDEGVFAHIAERLLDGERLHRDIQDLHPGYTSFLHAGCFKIWGVDLVSLRYPLLAGAFLQTIIIFVLLRHQGFGPAFLATMTINALGVVQFLNPNHHWYCLYLTVMLAGVVVWSKAPHRLPLLGFFLMQIFLFRQLTALWVALGVVVFLMLEEPEPLQKEKCFLASWFLLFSLAGLMVYFLKTVDVTGFLLFGIWPSLILLRTIFLTRISDARFWHVLKNLSFGAASGAGPLIFYHVSFGTLGDWLRDIFAHSGIILGHNYHSTINYLVFIKAGLLSFYLSTEWPQRMNGLYVLLLFLGPVINGILVLRHLKYASNPRMGVLMILSVFYGLVSLHFSSWVYLYFSAGLTWVSLLAIGMEFRKEAKFLWVSIILFLLGMGLYYHAGQSLNRGIWGTATGERRPLSGASCILPRCSLWIDSEDLRTYEKIVSFI